jgi:hypothetical protein
MIDAQTQERIRVFVPYPTLHGGALEPDVGFTDPSHGKAVLERNCIEEWLQDELEGKPSLWVQPSDLS